MYIKNSFIISSQSFYMIFGARTVTKSESSRLKTTQKYVFRKDLYFRITWLSANASLAPSQYFLSKYSLLKEEIKRSVKIILY